MPTTPAAPRPLVQRLKGLLLLALVAGPYHFVRLTNHYDDMLPALKTDLTTPVNPYEAAAWARQDARYARRQQQDSATPPAMARYNRLFDKHAGKLPK